MFYGWFADVSYIKHSKNCGDHNDAIEYLRLTLDNGELAIMVAHSNNPAVIIYGIMLDAKCIATGAGNIIEIIIWAIKKYFRLFL